ncbi:hypothetical protein J7W08_10460 [Methanococcoides orientis]|uniref:hypothetical protein n=1 Tax=Methanococcoides orientis TaxID=2822137 RepID=UPI001E38C019|nr:hypothetical protein [Methanococcoides orientis]UGV40476.1 hypothetical protein J7W08_10460 [Methanococcoides orientis]
MLVMCLTSSASAAASENETFVEDAAQLRLEETKERLGEDAVQEMEDYLELQKNLPAVVRAMPGGGSALAYAGTNNDSRVVYLNYIDGMDLSDEEKVEYKNKLIDVWDRYPDDIMVTDYAFMAKMAGLMEEEAKKVRDEAHFDEDGNLVIIVNETTQEEPGTNKQTPGFTSIMLIIGLLLSARSRK